MNTQNTKQIIFLSFIIPQIVLAASDIPTGNFWRCMAFDNEHKEWKVNSSYELAALNKALDACKKESKLPASCKTARESCEVFTNGSSNRPLWRCKALDQMAKSWPSNVYSHRDDAAIAATAYCQQGSSFPDTCYTNLMTCKNLNSRK